MPRRFFQYLFIFLLLAAQQSALVHATWHAAGDAQQQTLHDTHEQDAQPHQDDNHDTRQSSLCAFDLAFGQVLGGAHGSCVLPMAADLPTSIAGYIFNPRLGTEAVPAHSRGPPSLP